MIAFFKTDKGMVRHHNEDNGGIFHNKTGNLLAIVADGMGGHQAGEVASQIAVKKLQELWANVDEILTPEFAKSWFLEKVAIVNKEIYDHSRENKECEGMGTTLVAAICTATFATIVNIGDSRCYLLNENGFKQLTEDHSLVNELIKAGQISPEDAEIHPRKNVLLNAMGTEADIEMDITSITFEEGNKLLLCSDGLSNKVSSDEMLTILTDETDLNEKADTLIQLANHYGGEDNISLAIVTACPESGCD
ncbi:Stp1/IreP family PP2C-type Ser/Thr phosphatase [Bacillus sp. FJAT-49711]|uniref:Stp1/IreP family PP2C-type Ser/Thr phosphatase n=1 Tax=Bacillus sp. FJAT-49711 TaxID=2833585 RepID=UPI001BC8CC94|nr:Stp1/IreP family PP2C-type Ser/Thr phosphatase [Bacillus sp. FJAT-49711]MBS4217798.1 Stp1/IreP family PP2C-type Ser/Thr phosphatase [Bacillus sp. FJAT-49711]